NSSFKDFWVLVNAADLYSKIEVPSIGSKLNSTPLYFSIIPLVFWALEKNPRKTIIIIKEKDCNLKVSIISGIFNEK
ncbi:MAG: hypothetical protein ACI81S_002253, partial [Sphingobacteriales bacterium]